VDISGEVDSIERAAAFHHDARERGITILCGAGFDVVPSDCLLAHVAERLGGARTLRLAVSGLELVSRGSMRSLANELGRPTRVRHQGLLEAVSPGALQRSFDFGKGPAAGVAVSWGDLATAHYSTGVLNVETYFEATPSVFAVTQASRMFGGWLRSPAVREAIQRQAGMAPSPNDRQRAERRTTLVAQAEDARGRTVSSRLSAPEAYTLTAQTASAILERFRNEDFEPGFQTPSRLFGPDFILDFEGVVRVDSAC
jgi:short subunit dehydrogenase-like uncharacterized protein